MIKIGADALRDASDKLPDLTEQQIAVKDQLKRVHLLSPGDGIFHELTVHTVGGLIAPDEMKELVVLKQKLLRKTVVQFSDWTVLFGPRVHCLFRFCALNFA